MKIEVKLFMGRFMTIKLFMELFAKISVNRLGKQVK